MKKEKYTITLEDAAKWSFQYEIAGSYGMGSYKSLMVYGDMASPPYYKVFDHRQEMLLTKDLEAAVNWFNDLP